MSTFELIEYYVGLLIKQYAGLPKAEASIRSWVTAVVMPQTSVQTITFSPAPTSGTFKLSYGGVASSSLNWNSSYAAVAVALQGISSELLAVEVAGTIADGLTVTFQGVTPPALLLEEDSNALLSSGDPVSITIQETDLTLPLAVQNAFNLVGDDIAVGDQLDVLGKYAGVTRSGTILNGSYVTLNDADFLQLIRMAIVTNNAGSSLETIQDFLNQFFPGQIFVTDYQNMRLSYLMEDSIGSTDLVQMFITEGLLPKPMGVQISVAIVPDLSVLFAFRTYGAAMPNGKPFNRYGAWDFTWRWLSYVDIL